MYLLKEQSSHSRLHKVTTETGVPTAHMFPKNLKSWVRLKKNFEYLRKMERLSRNFILSEALGIFWQYLLLRTCILHKTSSWVHLQKLFEYVTENKLAYIQIDGSFGTVKNKF